MSSWLTRKGTLAGVTALVAVAAGCGGSHATSPSNATAPPNLAAAWHKVVLCARAHGMPNLQDPRIDPTTGKPLFPSGLNIPPETRRACQALVDRLIPSEGDHAPTAAQLAGLLRFARCMRAHGVSDWPDPRPDGTFAPDAHILHSLKSTIREPYVACDHLNPDPHGVVNFSQP